MQQVNKKVILIGNFGVGKTSLVRRFVHQKFSDEYLTTLGVKIDKKLVELNETSVNMLIWDVAGEVSQTKVPTSYYLGAHGIIYVFDSTRPSTFQNVTDDLEYVQKLLPKAPVCLVGNKKDLVPEEDLNKIGEQLQREVDFFTSALTGENVEKMFHYIALKMIE
ncbi:MAG: GTP-binding protein [Cytophagales bacterium]|nr:MAG: GTP-binding protein [Cytophagales bacterium]